MSVKTDLENSLREAMRAGDVTRKRTLRLALAAIKLEEVEKGQELSEAEIYAILQTEIKSRRETIADAEKAGRPDLAAEALEEDAVLQPFVPPLLAADEIEVHARQAIADLDAQTPGDMGKVMKRLIPQLMGRADGGEVSKIVRKLLIQNQPPGND